MVLHKLNWCLVLTHITVVPNLDQATHQFTSTNCPTDQYWSTTWGLRTSVLQYIELL